jgi:hypothetical protein
MSEAASFAQIVLAKEMIVTVKYRVVTNDMTSVCTLQAVVVSVVLCEPAT